MQPVTMVVDVRKKALAAKDGRVAISPSLAGEVGEFGGDRGIGGEGTAQEVVVALFALLGIGRWGVGAAQEVAVGQDVDGMGCVRALPRGGGD